MLRISKFTATNSLAKNDILNISKFVVKENFKHHVCTNAESSYNLEKDIISIYKEEMNYLENSHIFTLKSNEGEIIGAIRALKWDYINPLPIQKIFGIDPLQCIHGHPIHEIWHIGRFAIKKGAGDISLLKKLMVSAIKPICASKNNIAFAECDAKLLRVMQLMGIKTEVVGASIDYLGSETIPIKMTYKGLIGFYNKNKYLIGE